MRCGDFNLGGARRPALTSFCNNWLCAFHCPHRCLSAALGLVGTCCGIPDLLQLLSRLRLSVCGADRAPTLEQVLCSSLEWWRLRWAFPPGHGITENDSASRAPKERRAAIAGAAHASIRLGLAESARVRSAWHESCIYLQYAGANASRGLDRSRNIDVCWVARCPTVCARTSIGQP